MTETKLPLERGLDPPREPWRHIAVFLAIAVLIFLMSAVLFRALEVAF